MVAGEFMEVYGHQKSEWNCVVTCFFIDTAHNVIEYIETIRDILTDGGIWVNFGPLLYHYAEQEEELQIELSWEEVRTLILKHDFEIKVSKTRVRNGVQKEELRESVYTTDKDSLMQTVYTSIFFVAVKKAN